MTDLARIKRNVAKMAAMNAPEADIDGYIASEGVSIEDVRNYKNAPKLQPLSDEQKAKPKDDYSDGVAWEATKGALQGIASGLGRVASGATFGATDWLDRKTGGNLKALDDQLQADAEAEGLGFANSAGKFAADVGGNIKGLGGKLATTIADKGYKGLKSLLLNSAIGGGAYGVTSSDNLSDVPVNATANAVLGTALGTGLYGAGKGGLWAYNTMRPYANATANAVNNAVERLGLGKLQEFAKKASEKGRNVLEVGDDELLTATQEARQQSPKAYQNIDTAVENFNETQNARNNSIISDVFGNKGKYENTDEIIQRAKEQAEPFYQRLRSIGDLDKLPKKVYNQNGDLIIGVKGNPFIQQEIANIRKNPLYQTEYDVTKLPDTDWRILDQVNKNINDKIATAVRNGETETVRLLELQKYNLLNKVDEIVPEYKLARGIYEAEHKALKAQKIGEDALFDNNTSAEKLARTMKDMTDYEKRSLKVGAREKLINTIESKENQALGLKKLNNEQTQSKLKLVLGDKAEDIINYAEDEVKAMRNLNKLTKGSQTSEKQGIRDKIGLLGKIFKNPTGALGVIGEAMDSRINNASNDVLTQMLLEKGGNKLSQELNNYLTRATRAQQLRNVLGSVSSVGSRNILNME